MARWKFAGFELDSGAFELRHRGEPVRLEQNPFELLVLLVENRGQLVTREQIATRLWGTGVYVDTDLGINTAIRKVRQALDDDSASPQFVQTVIGKGYRFVAPLEVLPDATANEAKVAVAEAAPGRSRWRTPGFVLAVAVALLAIISYLAVRSRNAASRQSYRSVAVLPLANLSGDPGQEYFADGITDLLITQLAKIRGLQVVSRTTIARYKKSTRSAREIGSELHVDALVEGTVTRVDGRVRVTAQLIDAASDRHLWAEEYESATNDVIALQGRIARDVAAQLHVRLTAEERKGLDIAVSTPPEAFENYVRGRAAFERWTDEGTAQARDYFQRAIAIDPRYAEAWAAVAETYVFGPEYFRPLGSNAETAERFAKHALALDPRLGSAHAALAQVRFVRDWNWKAAGEGFARAVELSPNNPHIRHLYSHYLLSCGRSRESLEHANRMIQLEPASASAFNHLAYHHLKSGRYDLSLQAANQALRIEPNYGAALTHRALAHLARREYAQSVASFVELYRLSGAPSADIESAEDAFRRGGWQAFVEDDLRMSLASIESDEKAGKPANDSRAWGVAQDYALLGRNDEAFTWLEKCFRMHCARMTELREDEILAPLRSDPRYRDLERRLGVPDVP